MAETAAVETVFDLIVIGSGPGGYTGAIRAAQLGLKTAIVEKGSTLGGTCLNIGCIPSKALLDASEHFEQASHEFASWGIKAKVELDLPTMLGRKDRVVKELTTGVAFLMKKNKITVFTGLGNLKSATQVEVKMADGKSQILQGKAIMLATGSVPVELPHLKFDGKRIVSSTEALNFSEVPKHLAVVGGGVIGLELGSVWLRLGAKVTVIEFNNAIAGGTDKQTANLLLRVLKKQGMEFMLETKVVKSEVLKDGVELTYEAAGKTASLKADMVLVSVGRKPFSDGLGLETVGIAKDERGRVKTDHHYQTNVPGIYAIGDLIAGPMLAHKAEEEGVAVAEILAGLPGHVNYDTVPNVIYTWPELASVGLTEEQLKEKGVEYKAGSFPFIANGRAKAMGATDGQIKILADAKTDKVLGVHILGPRASDVLSEAVIAMEFGASSEDIARSFHSHPTLSEVMREAALNVDKRARQG